MIVSISQSQHAPTGEEALFEAGWDDARLVAALRRGDEPAFVLLVERCHRALLRLARCYVSSDAVAEEVVQETWLGVLQGLPRFEGRSSLRTWIFRILTNRAKTRGQREARSVPLSALEADGDEGPEPAVDPEHFHSIGSMNGGWAIPPQSWEQLPEERLLSAETRACIDTAIAALPGRQRLVMTLRDVEGLSSQDVCGILEVSEANQRVLLHRARSRVRSALEQYLAPA